MTELWAVIGLAMLDGKFNEELKEAREDLHKLGEEVQEYGFRLSCYELVELQRIISTRLTDIPAGDSNVLDLMYYMSTRLWTLGDPCWWAWWEAAFNSKKELNPKYQHPYLVFDENTGKNVPGAVDPQTGDPINNELFDKQFTIDSTVIPPGSRKRFAKAKNLK
jgi:hypothetical protein